MLACHLPNLLSLLVDDVRRVSKVVVNQLLVGLVDEGTKEQDRGGDQGKTPEWNHFDQIVGEKSAQESLWQVRRATNALDRGKTHGSGSKHVLCEDNTLRLNDKEVDQLVDVADNRIKSLFGDGVVLARTELGGKSSAQNGLSNNLGQNSHAQSHPCQPEGISEHVQVPGGEDEDDSRRKSDPSSAGVLPREEAGEERVVMSELLATSRGCGRSGARGSEIRELVLCLDLLVLHVLDHGTCCRE